MINCKLEKINRVKHSIPLKMGMHSHGYNEITYFISGSGTTEINGKVYPYKAGDFAFYKSGTLHNEYDPVPCDIIWMHFTFNMPNISLNEGVYDDVDGKMLSLLQKLRNLSFENSVYNDYLTESVLAEITITASQLQNKDLAANRINWKKILNYIDGNINEQIDFSLLAKNYNYSYDRFRHLFSEHFGISPYAYLTKQRISHAKRLLKSSNSAITDIALDCGFNSPSQFTNVFKKHTGITPKEYQKSKRNKISF